MTTVVVASATQYDLTLLKCMDVLVTKIVHIVYVSQ